jgi:hypothetical protein
MLRSLLAGATAIAILLFVAACGGSSSFTSTPASTPSATTTPQTTATVATSPRPTASPTTAVIETAPPGGFPPCQTNQLYGALVSDAIAEPRVLTLGIGNTLSTCILANPPQIHWYDETGASIDDSIQRPATTNVACGPRATDFTVCVDTASVMLPGDEPLPAANVKGPIVAVVSVTTSGLCVDPAIVTAHFVGLSFPSTTLDVQIELTPDVQFLRCAAQVALQGYGPS